VLVLGLWAARWWRTAPVAKPADGSGAAIRVAAAGAVVLAAAVGAVRGFGFAHGTNEVFYVIVGAVSWAGAALVGVAALWQLREFSRTPG
jgi:hypothetical protein